MTASFGLFTLPYHRGPFLEFARSLKKNGKIQFQMITYNVLEVYAKTNISLILIYSLKYGHKTAIFQFTEKVFFLRSY